jgi:hypothetical protein
MRRAEHGRQGDVLGGSQPAQRARRGDPLAPLLGRRPPDLLGEDGVRRQAVDRTPWRPPGPAQPPTRGKPAGQYLNEPAEYDPVGDPGAMAAERMLVDPRWQQAWNWSHKGSAIQDGSTGTAV